ncbi:bifunctional phosphopantothenoylcysteine decarboxylase/phosphopantothenate--cysteine ligase CoaBC [Psychromonas sp. Urea-02u-13]|uniref:bifunctional phosphopantothenoylcysteine decarboxylase/phosphopantothenate--cysteine ligase CoaBC n=1 Tax=Psychromonas sp. Urea-02u-13 TaxID=2058326 RepID=UPI000C33A1A9|nr:bifunctional phosphopantothenoylcysteine decarboxylase/phosphopantothenate--cysteine ligase CoaBC [Psychromonas sp. Urea-02u-13]PKG38182.1 bifunctional phosphopantothenoylcysteine decarboxylase/phosphopantothenate--cysteine ligase CoaBC [Psychromonas sp. Urea-02u-13]
MSALTGKKILLGISGGIAAYKCAELTRRLKDQGADVRIVMTKAAKEFITPLTMQAVSGYAIADSLLDPSAEAGMGHIELAKWADLVLLAPATANLIARLRAGFADELLTTLCLASPAPIAVSPAMNMKMYFAPATQENITVLAERGLHIWGPGKGPQACGDIGPGRLLEPSDLVQRVIEFFAPVPQLLAGVSVTITAGPTQEALDPVRYISNHSSGKMGFSLAEMAQRMGANVTLISGPVSLATPLNVKRIDVCSAMQMHKASLQDLAQCDIFIACAAVADYRPEHVEVQKMKKQQGVDDLTIKLIKNPDIIADVASANTGTFCVGFAAETQDVERYALDKLKRKKLKLIAANDVAKSGQGFNSEKNALTVFSETERFDITLADKKKVANQLLVIIAQQYLQST